MQKARLTWKDVFAWVLNEPRSRWIVAAAAVIVSSGLLFWWIDSHAARAAVHKVQFGEYLGTRWIYEVYAQCDGTTRVYLVTFSSGAAISAVPGGCVKP